MKQKYVLQTVMVLVGLVLSACGNRGPQTFVPTETPNPLAFFDPTPISPGRAENPLQILFVPPDPAAIEGMPVTLGDALSQASGLAIQVITVPDTAQALSQLCDYQDEDRFAAAWLNGPAAVAASERGCGDIALQAVRSGRQALAGQVIARAGIGSLNNVQGRSFCRLDVGDFYSWVLPVLAFEASGLDLLRIQTVKSNYLDYEQLVDRVGDGECDAAGVPAGQVTPEEAAAQGISVIYESPPMPYSLLVYPPELLLGDRVALTEAFLEVAGYDPALEADPDATEEAAAESDEPTPTFEPVLTTVDESQLSSERLALLRLLGADAVEIPTPELLLGLREFVADTTAVQVASDAP